jgi:pSer/pThr/pTyr-binding forkhead associated (FHA) protein
MMHTMIQAKLIMFRGNGERRELNLNADRTIIGRRNDCDIRIPLTEVSRHHTELRIENGRVVLKDLGSSNGTFVNNQRVKTTTLAAGDHVIIGPVVFTLQLDGEPRNIRPVKTRIQRQKPAASGIVDRAEIAAPIDAVVEDELDPISALEALASSADQTAIDPFEDEEL